MVSYGIVVFGYRSLTAIGDTAPEIEVQDQTAWYVQVDLALYHVSNIIEPYFVKKRA